MAAKTITVSKTEFPVSFSGVEGAGTASVSGTKTGVKVGAVTPKSALSNGATVTVDFTPVTAGDTINPSSLTYTVAGLTAAPAGALKDDFIKGNKLRDTTDVTGTEYDTEVDKEAVDDTVTTTAKSAALFDENAMDPYEVNHAQ